MQIIRDPDGLAARIRAWRQAGETVGVVPTMGALHGGHLSLARAARADGGRVIATLFVNPMQFDNPADLAKYPRTEDSDRALLEPEGVDVLFMPDAATIYPPGFATKVIVKGLPDVLCGAHRPGHFDGVATVVTKLLMLTRADRAYFGEKDWQQLQIIRRMASDLNIPCRIIGCPTLREADGLAMSSRNRRLTAGDRTRAPALHRAMAEAAGAIGAGTSVAAALAGARAATLAAGFERIDYLELRSGEGLEALDHADPGARIFAAAWIGGIRLIDNIPL